MWSLIRSSKKRGVDQGATGHKHGKQSYSREKVLLWWGMTREILGTSPQGNSFHDFLCPGTLPWPGSEHGLHESLFLAKQSSSSKTHCISFSLNLLALQRQDLGGPLQQRPFSISVYLPFFSRIPGQAWCQTLPLRLISITPRVMFKHSYSLVINTNYHELTCTSVCVSVSSMPPEDGWI